MGKDKKGLTKALIVKGEWFSNWSLIFTSVQVKKHTMNFKSSAQKFGTEFTDKE